MKTLIPPGAVYIGAFSVEFCTTGSVSQCGFCGYRLSVGHQWQNYDYDESHLRCNACMQEIVRQLQLIAKGK